MGTIEIRDLVQFIKGDKKRNFTINIPDIIEYKDAPKQTIPKLTYKELVIEYISKHRNHPVLEKIHSMQQLTHADILALEQICWEELGTKEEYQNYVKRGCLICGDSVAAFIRSIIKVDRTRALELYSNFLSNSVLNPEQEEYVKCVRIMSALMETYFRPPCTKKSLSRNRTSRLFSQQTRLHLSTTYANCTKS